MIWEWISLFIYLKSKRIVWIYTSCTLILGLAKERNNQSINTRIITDKDKIKVSLVEFSVAFWFVWCWTGAWIGVLTLGFHFRCVQVRVVQPIPCLSPHQWTDRYHVLVWYNPSQQGDDQGLKLPFTLWEVISTFKWRPHQGSSRPHQKEKWAKTRTSNVLSYGLLKNKTCK